MILDTVTKTNAKGQIVIPKKFREALGISRDVLLNLSLKGRGVYITPVEATLSSKDSKLLFLEILNKTAGTWGNDSWPKTKKQRKMLELKASRKRKTAW